MQAKIDRIVQYMQAHPGKTANQVRRSLSYCNVKSAEVQAAAKQCGYTFGEPAQASAPPVHTQPSLPGGIPITGQRLMPRKPADSVKVHLRRLPTDRAFPVEDLSHRLGISPETIRRHARDMKCLLYMEVAPDDWQHVVLNPETASKYANEL